jgi:hypothetical protein
MLGKLTLDPVPALVIDDRGMKAFMDLILVGQPTDVDRVRQDLIEMPSADQPASGRLAPAIGSSWQPDVLLIQSDLEPHDAADLEIAPKEIAHEDGMLLDDMERPIVDPIAERDHAAHPDAFLLEAAILSRMRSPVTSRSNWANDRRTFKVSRPILVVVLNAWVTATNDTRCSLNSSTVLAKSASERVSRSTL